MQTEKQAHNHQKDNWKGWYLFVLLFLLLQIGLFTLFTRYFS